MAEIAELIFSSPISKAIAELQETFRELGRQMAKVEQMARIREPLVIPELERISPERSIESLLRYIAILEAELERKRKELAEKDEEIRRLRKLLREGKKELKGYVA